MLKIIILFSFISFSFADTKTTDQIQARESTKALTNICQCYAVDADQRFFYGSSRRSQDQAMQRAIVFCMSGTQMPGTCVLHSCQCR